MSASLSIPFAIGATVWLARTKSSEAMRPCAVCCGKKSVVLILGDGEQVTVDCDNCERGYLGPSGVEASAFYHRSVPDVRQVTLTQLTELRDGVARYTDAAPGSGCYSTFDATDLFESHADALKRAQDRCDENDRNIDEHNAKARSRTGGRRKVPSVGAYLLSTRARLREELANIEAKLKARGEG